MADELEKLILAEGPDTVAAMFMEPVPKAATPIKLAAITMEPEGGSKTPTMPIRWVIADK